MEILGLEIASDPMMVLIQLPTMTRQALPCNPSSLAAAVLGEGLELMLWEVVATRELLVEAYSKTVMPCSVLNQRESMCATACVSE